MNERMNRIINQSYYNLLIRPYSIHATKLSKYHKVSQSVVLIYTYGSRDIDLGIVRSHIFVSVIVAIARQGSRHVDIVRAGWFRFGGVVVV